MSIKAAVKVINNVTEIRELRRAKEILKTNLIVNLISWPLRIISFLGCIAIIGFANSLYIPGEIIGLAMLVLPFLWFSWLDGTGWNEPEVDRVIERAKRTVEKYKD